MVNPARGDAEDFMRTPLQSLQVESGTLRIHVGRVFYLDQIADALLHGGEFRRGKDRRTDLLTCTYFCRFFSYGWSRTLRFVTRLADRQDVSGRPPDLLVTKHPTPLRHADAVSLASFRNGCEDALGV
jgi:hypothetical protein